jgi:hypothetical protein
VPSDGGWKSSRPDAATAGQPGDAAESVSTVV